MHEPPGLFNPPAHLLPLLFEIQRLLGRYPELGEAFEPLVGLLQASTPLREGALALAEGGEFRVRLASSLPQARAGQRVLMGEGPLGLALEADRLVEGRLGEGAWLALPAGSGGSRDCLLAFALEPAELVGARSLLEALGILLGEAFALRKSLLGRLSARSVTALAAGPLASAKGEFLDLEGAERSAGAAAGLAAPLHGLLGRSAAMAELRSLIAQVGPTEATVLLGGESGTGKELAARALHESSPRAAGPFVAVNCAALPESLIESELFGHERGAFTGAEARRRGRFELASGGTLFFDEIGELGPAVQVKLLRVLQERRFERVGGSESLRADLRIIAATNRELDREVAAGRFREDLYYRLNVFPLRLPPLRERGGDVVLLADHFAERLGTKLGKPVLRISTPALDLLTSYHWPGNVRELENAIERAVVLSTDGVIHAWQLPPSLQSAASTGTGPTSTLDATLARMERELIVEALKMAEGVAARAAQSLGISERRFGLAMRKYNISWRRFRTKR